MVSKPSSNPGPSNTTTLITGANRGLGLGFVRYYLERGGHVIATARNPDQASELKALAAAHQDALQIIPLDVSQSSSLDDLATSLQGCCIDRVINNAGISSRENLGDWSAKEMKRVLQVNTIGPALVAQAVLPHMRDGSILIQLSSGLGSIALNINPEDGMDAYAASKAALNMLCRRLASKLEPRGIIVIAISPGWVRTDMGGSEADLSVSESVKHMAESIEQFEQGHSGGFYNHKGEAISW